MNPRTQLLVLLTYGFMGGLMGSIALQLPGCKGTPYTSMADPKEGIDDADRSLAKVPERMDKIDEHVESIEKRVPKKSLAEYLRDTIPIKALTGATREDVSDSTEALARARKESSALQDQLQNVAGQLEAEKKARADDLDHWYVRWGRPIDRIIRAAWWLFLIVTGGGLVLRIIGMFAGGWVGATVAKIGSIGLHFLPWVGGIANQFFDNAYFRQRQYHLDAPKPAPPVGVVVEQPLDPEGDVTAVSQPMAMQIAPVPVYTSTVTKTTRKPVRKRTK